MSVGVMEIFHMHTVLQYALVLLAFWVLVFPRRKSAADNLPPSPRALPLIGHLHLLGSVPHVNLRALSKRYGPLMLLRTGSTPTLVVSSSDIAKEVLHTQDSVFASRPVKVAGEVFLYGSKNMAFSPNNAHWKNLRKLCSMELFTTKRLNSFDGLIKEELCQFIFELLRCSGKQSVIDLRNQARVFSFNVITRIIMRKTYFGPDKSSDDHVAAEFVELMSLVPKALGEFCIGDLFPSLWWINSLKWRNIRRRVDEFLESVLADHRQKNNCSSEDFVDLMISHLGWDHAAEIKANVWDLLVAGTDTAPTVIEWAFAELLRNPDILQRAQAELMNTVGTRMVEFDDIPKLEFMHAVIKETMRLHPPAPLLIPHFSTRECKLGSYNVPEKALVLVNTYAIGRDEKLWSDPESFQPERFMGSSINIHGFNFELLPFGAGRRTCPGLPLGVKLVQYALCNLVHLFNWNYPEGVTAADQSMEGTSGLLSNMATPLQVRVVPRFRV